MNTDVENRAIQELIDGNTKPIEECLRGWIILIDGRVFKPRVGNFIFSTRKQAVKAFYNNMRWRVAVHLREANGDSTWRNASTYWARFKRVLGDRFEVKHI